MVNKQTMQLTCKEDDEIIGIKPAIASFVDEDYFKKEFKDRQNDPDKAESKYFTFAVKVQCVRADWIINDPEYGI